MDPRAPENANPSPARAAPPDAEERAAKLYEALKKREAIKRPFAMYDAYRDINPENAIIPLLIRGLRKKFFSEPEVPKGQVAPEQEPFTG